jgi:hypothetical protein
MGNSAKVLEQVKQALDDAFDEGYEQGSNENEEVEDILDYADEIEELAKFIDNSAVGDHHVKVIINRLLKVIDSNVVVK